jgi:tetratricopeptide (TPR) repeat protein
MERKHFNWTAAVVFIIAAVVLTVTAFGLRKWQRRRMAYEALEAGLKAYENRTWEDAAKNLGRYIAVDRSDVRILMKYADAQLNIRPIGQNNVRQVIETYRSILRTDKNNAASAEKLISLYLETGAPAEAELIAGRFLQNNKDPEIRRLFAESLSSQRKFSQAQAQLRTIIEEYPAQVQAYEALGLMNESRPDDFSTIAEHWFDEAVKNNPSSAQAFIARAGFYLRNKDNIKALADLEKAEQLDLSDLSDRLRLACEYIEINAFDKSRIHLNRIQSQEPANQMLWQIWAMLALKTESKEEILRVAKAGLKALSSQPWDFMPAATELFLHCGEFKLAEDCISRLKQKGFEPAVTEFFEGLWAESRGQDYKAISHWRNAIRSGNKSEKVILALAAALSRVGDRQSAVLYLRQLVSEQPNLLQGYLELARLLSQVGSWSDAAEQARLAFQIAPANLDAVLMHIQTRMYLIGDGQSGGNKQALLEVEKQLSELEKAAGGKLEIRLLQFQLAIRQKRFETAEKILADLRVSDGNQLEVEAAEIDLLVAQEKLDPAIAKLRVLTERFPQSVWPVKYLTILSAGRGYKEDCEKLLKNAIKNAGRSETKRELGLLLACLYRQWGEGDKPFNLLSLLSQELPCDIFVRRQLLECEQVKGDARQAQQLIDDIKAVEGESGWQWRYEQAMMWFTGENFKEHYPQIIILLKENLVSNPDDQTSRMLLAAVYEKAGDLQLAVEAYNAALNRSPDDVHIIVPSVAAMYRAKQYERVNEILSRLEKQKLICPELSGIELQNCLRQGKFGSAEDILEEMAVKNPDDQNIILSLALLKMRQNKCDQARELLGELKSNRRYLLPVTAALVELNIRQKKNKDALALCDEVVSRIGNSSSYVLRGKAFSMLGQNDRARRDFEQAVSIEPNNVQAWVAKSDFNRSIGRSEEAVGDMEKAFALEPENLQVQKHFIVSLLSSDVSDKINKGKELLDKALSSNPEDMELNLYKARLLLAAETAPDIEQAQLILRRITKEQPGFSDAWVLLAESYLGQVQAGKALDIILNGLTYSPNDKNLLMLKARCEAARAPASAVATLGALKELYPNDSDVVVNLAEMYIASGQCEKGIKMLRCELADSNNMCDRKKISTALAVALYKNGNKAEAEREFMLLSQTVPDNSEVFLAEARLLKDDQNWPELRAKAAVRLQRQSADLSVLVALAGELSSTKNEEALKVSEDILRMVLEKTPRSIEVLNKLAMLLQARGNSSKSAEFYERILDIEPNAVIAINNLAWIMCEEQGRYRQSLQFAQRGLKIAPQYIDLIDTRGLIYYRLGEYDKAVADFTRCVELYPKDSPSLIASYFHLGRALAALGQNDKAVDNLRVVLDSSTKSESLSPVDLAEAERILAELSEKKNRASLAN